MQNCLYNGGLAKAVHILHYTVTQVFGGAVFFYKVDDVCSPQHCIAAVNWHSDSEHLLVWGKEMKLRSMQTGVSVQAQMARKCHQSAALNASKPAWKQLIYTRFSLLTSPTCFLCSACLKCSHSTFISTLVINKQFRSYPNAALFST